MDASDAADDQQLCQALQAALGDKFEVRRVLGRGSMATVFLAWERSLDRMVAIKVLLPESAADETARRRFDREAQSAASLSHPNIVDVHQFGRLPDQTPYLVMQFVKGRTLEELVTAQGPLEMESAIEILDDVASALAAAHARGIIHRDVRPANILWKEVEGEAVLADFGIAALIETSGEEITKLTAAGTLLGDPRFVSPEQLRDEPLTELSDVYGFGVLGYILLSGEGPYAVTNDSDWLNAHRTAQPRDLRDLRKGVDPNIAALLRRCLNKEARHRPTAADIVRALRGQWRLDPFPRLPIVSALVARRVPQAVVGVGIVSWGIVEGVSTLIERSWLPEVSFALALAFAAAAVAASGVVAWFHGDRTPRQAPASEYAILSAIAFAWVVASVFVVR
jgi:serine/threonine-protein kinase